MEPFFHQFRFLKMQTLLLFITLGIVLLLLSVDPRAQKEPKVTNNFLGLITTIQTSHEILASRYYYLENGRFNKRMSK